MCAVAAPLVAGVLGPRLGGVNRALLPGSFLFLVIAAASCSDSGSTGGDDGGAVSPTCLDGAGKPTSSCAVTPSGDICELGDANACTALSKLDVYADDGTNGVCMHLVFDVTCETEAFSYTCIEHQDPDEAPSWQCWTSSSVPGSKIDVDQCHATGKYFHVASTSSGQLDIDQMKCPAPSI